MRKKATGATALLCAAAITMGVLSGCAESPASSVPSASSGLQADSEPKTLAEHLEEQATDLVQSFEERGMSEEEITELSPAAGYLASLVLEYRGFICVPGAEGAESFAYMYDNAAAIIALARAGANWYAWKIADAMVYAMEHDRSFTDGRLRNAYRGATPAPTPAGPWLGATGR